MIRTAFAVLVLIVMTVLMGSWVIVAALLGVKDRVGSPYDRAPRWWAKAVVWASGVKVVVHGAEHANAEGGVFVVNHVSLFDVLAVASVLSRAKFVAKAELANVPLFSRAMRSAGMVFIERENRKAAFDSYKHVAGRVGEGSSVVVYAEGTRGRSYALRPFKKGPFVLAIGAQAPVIPLLVYGTITVLPPGPLHVRPGVVHLHFHAPIPTAGLDYDARDTIAATAHARMAATLRTEYGVESEVWEPRRAVLG
ncbi:MAG: 1-acyl-sn-glycerol-3-phosphate acyltransferase [Gemmatimonadetes bacterium]|nr:1-acyl-sn-glycerol-3-phosphate acyltransferase [Gemmatimonadota bacterium]